MSFRNPLAGFWKTCGIGLFYRNYRSLLEETRWLDCWLASVCLETHCLGQNPWFLSPGTTLYTLGWESAESTHGLPYRRGGKGVRANSFTPSSI